MWETTLLSIEESTIRLRRLPTTLNRNGLLDSFLCSKKWTDQFDMTSEPSNRSRNDRLWSFIAQPVDDPIFKLQVDTFVASTSSVSALVSPVKNSSSATNSDYLMRSATLDVHTGHIFSEVTLKWHLNFRNLDWSRFTSMETWIPCSAHPFAWKYILVFGKVTCVLHLLSLSEPKACSSS